MIVLPLSSLRSLGRRAPLLFLLAGLAACSHLPHLGNGASTPAVDEGRLVLDTIAYAQKTAAASADTQRRELNEAQQAFGREHSAANRLRYGTLLALPTLTLEDEGRAAAILEPLTATGNGPVRQFAGLLLAQVTDRVREKRRSTQLKEQLAQLKAIERQLIDRGKAGK